jgi:hypothetical protein
MKFSKKLLLLACLMIAPLAMAKKTKKIQLLVFPDSTFEMNAGDGISTDDTAIRPAGATVVSSFLIFPGGTVSKHQTDFSVDRNGKVLRPQDNIGMMYMNETMIAELDFDTPPVKSTRLSNVNYAFRFKKQCQNASNTGDDYVFASGQNIAGVLPAEVGVAVLKLVAAVSGGTGCNQYQVGNGFVAHAYSAVTGTVPTLIQLEFDNDVQYNK